MREADMDRETRAVLISLLTSLALIVLSLAMALLRATLSGL
jgi:hypothetical protein